MKREEQKQVPLRSGEGMGLSSVLTHPSALVDMYVLVCAHMIHTCACT